MIANYFAVDKVLQPEFHTNVVLGATLGTTDNTNFYHMDWYNVSPSNSSVVVRCFITAFHG